MQQHGSLVLISLPYFWKQYPAIEGVHIPAQTPWHNGLAYPVLVCSCVDWWVNGLKKRTLTLKIRWFAYFCLKLMHSCMREKVLISCQYTLITSLLAYWCPFWSSASFLNAVHGDSFLDLQIAVWKAFDTCVIHDDDIAFIKPSKTVAICMGCVCVNLAPVMVLFFNPYTCELMIS